MQESRFSFSIKTMGCKANLFDSLVLEQELIGLGGEALADQHQKPDVVILNSCTVTQEADKQAHQWLQQSHKKNESGFRVVTGCYAEVAPEKLKQDPNASLVLKNTEKHHLRSILAERFNISTPLDATPGENVVPGSEAVYWGQLPIERGKTRAFLKIQEGCNDYCTYCIIPDARGPSRSIRLGSILSEIQRLVDAGVKEVVLTGTNIADYGKDCDLTFEDLVSSILVKTNISRLRLSSLDPGEITDRLLDLMRDHAARLMPHLHISLQSANSRVLRAMKRHYREAEIESALSSIYALNPDIFVGMDVIAGFPSETDDEHKSALALLSRLPWSRLHVFPYSEREGTAALKIAPKVPQQTRKQRTKEFLDLSKKRNYSFCEKFIGKTLQNILFESHHEVAGECFAVGHAPNYLRCVLSTGFGADALTRAMELKNTVKDVNVVGVHELGSQEYGLLVTNSPTT
jgi:threonylcarbamoyladenosine tRNA methylthiotransferase MtaB